MLPNITTMLKTEEITAIVGKRVYRHGNAPQDSDKPYITWQAYSVVPENNLSDKPPIDRISLQIDCWHLTDSGIEQLATLVRNAMEDHAHMTGVPIDERDNETKLFRMAMQFDVWLDR